MKFWVILIMAAFVNANDIRIREAATNLESLFSAKNDPTKNCGGIEGSLDKNCHECYMCDDDRIKNYKTEVKQLKLKSADCKTVSTVCCIPQIALGIRTAELLCGRKGTYNSDNRATVRSVLHHEYPWRVWIFKKDNYGNGELLCAGTVVEVRNWIVMTSASCVHGLRPDQLAVGLTSSFDGHVTNAKSINIHPSYTPSQKFENDIALLLLDKEQAAPTWVEPICLAATPPMPATSCITISEKNFYISTVVPMPKTCESFNIKSALGQICAIAPLDDYNPQVGGALFCLDEQTENHEFYYVAGIALATTDSVTTYTAVHHYYDWIKDKIGMLAST